MWCADGTAVAPFRRAAEPAARSGAHRMPPCVKCARVDSGAGPLCADCERQATGADAAAAPDVAAPGAVVPPSAGISLPTRAVWAARVRPWHVGVAIAAAAGAAAIAVALFGTGGIGGQSLPATEQASMLAVARVARDAPAALAVDRWTDANSARWVGNYRRSIAFELTSENTASAGLARVRPILVVRCLANATDVFVYTQWPAAIEPQDDRRTIHISFDGESGSTERWFTSPDR